MELRSFISKSLEDIYFGVVDAQGLLPSGVVIPAVSKSFQSVETKISDIQGIAFDVIVTVDQKKGSEAKINVVTGIFGGGVKGSSGMESGHTARLSFSVPIKFPKPE